MVLCFRSIPCGKLPDRSGPASCRTGKCCNSKFSCIAWSIDCFAGMSDREPEGSGSVPESVHDASLQVSGSTHLIVYCIRICTVTQVTSLWCICIPIVSTNTCQHWPTGLQVLAGEARSGEGARLPLQDHDLRPQPADQQLLTARLVLLENHQSTVWWRKRCLRENDTWDYPLARKLWWVEENGPKIDTEYIYILLIDWPNPLMVDRSIPIFI